MLSLVVLAAMSRVVVISSAVAVKELSCLVVEELTVAEEMTVGMEAMNGLPHWHWQTQNQTRMCRYSTSVVGRSSLV